MIGQLSERVILQRPDRTPDAGGGAAVVWTTVATLWARVESAAAGEEESAGRLAARVSHEVRLRRRGDVRPGWRVLHRGRPLRVRGVVEAGPGLRWTDLLCEEEAS